MGPQVTAAIFIFILLQKSSSPLQSDRSSPLLSNLVPSQSCKCSWVSSESCEQSLQPMLFTWECLKLPLTPAVALALYLIHTLTLGRDILLIYVKRNKSSDECSFSTYPWYFKILILPINKYWKLDLRYNYVKLQVFSWYSILISISISLSILLLRLFLFLLTTTRSEVGQ